LELFNRRSHLSCVVRVRFKLQVRLPRIEGLFTLTELLRDQGNIVPGLGIERIGLQSQDEGLLGFGVMAEVEKSVAQQKESLTVGGVEEERATQGFGCSLGVPEFKAQVGELQKQLLAIRDDRDVLHEGPLSAPRATFIAEQATEHQGGFPIGWIALEKHDEVLLSAGRISGFARVDGGVKEVARVLAV
jgi:hypothetical protein